MQARILVPVDDSAEAQKAVEEAVRLASGLDASVTLMTVVATPMLPRQLLEPAQLDLIQAHFRQAGEQVLEQLRPVAEATGVPVETKCVEGVPYKEILTEASRGYSLIVMGARGIGLAGRDRTFLGSVSDRVLRQAPVPVLLVRDTD